MSATIPILIVLSVCLALASFVAFFLYWRKTAAARRADPGGTATAPASIALDLGGRLPARRRRPCGRHGEDGGNCDDCAHKHDHDDEGCEHGHSRETAK